MAGQCYKGLRFKVIDVTRVAGVSNLQRKNGTYHLKWPPRGFAKLKNSND